MSFTEGKWEAKGYEVYAPYGSGTIRICRVDSTNEAANANLIAAAPELLFAAKIGLTYIEAIRAGVPRPIADLKDDKEIVEAAISAGGGKE